MAWYRCRHTGSGGGVTPIGDATDGDVLSGKTYMNANGASTGTMTNNGAVSPSGLNCGGSYTIPEGYHNGSGTVTANSLASQTGVDSGKTAIGASQVLTGYQGWVNGSKVSGTMANNGATGASNLSAGGSYTIPAGYTTGGSVTTKTLAAQTGVDSGKTAVTAGTMVSGYQGWVNGTKITGTFAGQEKTSTPTTRSATAETVTPDSGKYLTKVTVNTNSVPNSNSGTKTITSSDTNWYTGNVDMGATNTYRYVNATNVYNKGKNDGISSITYRLIANGGSGTVGGYYYAHAFHITNKALKYLNYGRFQNNGGVIPGYFAVYGLQGWGQAETQLHKVNAFHNTTYKIDISAYNIIHLCIQVYAQQNDAGGAEAGDFYFSNS